MNSDSLKTFIMLASCLSFTKTAHELMIVQSTVSSRIKELEAEIGQQLLTRGKNNVSLTPAGRVFLKYAMKMVEMEEAAIKEVNMIKRFKGQLEADITHTLYDCHLSYFLQDFMRRNSDISLKINIAHSSEIITRLGGHCPDIAFIYYDFHHPNYICVPFVKDRVILVTNKENRRYKKGITKEALFSQAFIFSDFLSFSEFEWLLPKQRIYPLDINVVSRMIPYMMSGDLYCFLPRQLVIDEINTGKLIEIPLIDIEIPDKQSYMVYKSTFQKSEVLKRCLDAIRNYQGFFNSP